MMSCADSNVGQDLLEDIYCLHILPIQGDRMELDLLALAACQSLHLCLERARAEDAFLQEEDSGRWAGQIEAGLSTRATHLQAVDPLNRWRELDVREAELGRPPDGRLHDADSIPEDGTGWSRDMHAPHPPEAPPRRRAGAPPEVRSRPEAKSASGNTATDKKRMVEDAGSARRRPQGCSPPHLRRSAEILTWRRAGGRPSSRKSKDDDSASSGSRHPLRGRWESYVG